ncbi:hypothetical protein B7494_g202 [Chlorociboria aeruginascens]|nr:hypothetical protein B7494_g202 [Chlorociboria aeruginascens]
MPPKYNLNSRTITAPLAAATMALLLFVYAKTSISAAKRNAQKHREADGGQINWQNESLRRHGQLDPPVEQDSIKQLVGLAKENSNVGKGIDSEAEEKVRGRRGKGKGSD